MSTATKEQAEKLVDELAQKSDPDAASKIDAKFETKLEHLEAEGKAPADMLEKLRVLWDMFHASDDVVPWKAKALIMAALTYFISPLDMIPDFAGKPGYMDDKMVVAIVYSRLEKDIAAFKAARP